MMRIEAKMEDSVAINSLLSVKHEIAHALEKRIKILDNNLSGSSEVELLVLTFDQESFSLPSWVKNGSRNGSLKISRQG
ncbi:hypothetical protein Nepgr_004707 [Nepenthes gracilis]|uniref:Uncharacterized protein n=1 Tax=Nepenthes gracilis TaxID=150966 RepID=A0AAD3S1S9_NEPGR|nr:hypothetical protein Nepgr_004707 [Nepenthes gracilis]